MADGGGRGGGGGGGGGGASSGASSVAGSSRTYAMALLRRQLKELMDHAPEFISVGAKEDNIFEWNVTMQGPPGTPFEGGLFEASLKFPDDFPANPPEMKFTSEMWHPNIFPDGKVCISILHAPGVDPMNEMESALERWRPILSVEAVLISVLSMLGDPNDSSPANIDAAKQWREDRKGFNRRARRCAEKSLGEE